MNEPEITEADAGKFCPDCGGPLWLVGGGTARCGRECGGQVVPTAGSLTADFVRTFPGGVLDDSAYSDIEAALDRCDAPCQDAAGKWLTLPDRVLALARELGREPR